MCVQFICGIVPVSFHRYTWMIEMLIYNLPWNNNTWYSTRLDSTPQSSKFKITNATHCNDDGTCRVYKIVLWIENLKVDSKITVI